MRAGRKDRRIAIEVYVAVQDGFGEEIKTWSLVDPVAAEVTYPDPAAGNEQFAADQITSQVMAFFKIDYRVGISPRRHRIIFEGKQFDILSVAEIGRREALKIVGVAKGV